MPELSTERQKRLVVQLYVQIRMKMVRYLHFQWVMTGQEVSKVRKSSNIKINCTSVLQTYRKYGELSEIRFCN